MREIFLYPAAEVDLENIWQYTYITWGIQQAHHYVDEFNACFATLADTPRIGRERSEYQPSLYIYQHSHHLVLYHYSDTSIEVIRILHKSMDVDLQLESTASKPPE